TTASSRASAAPVSRWTVACSPSSPSTTPRPSPPWSRSPRTPSPRTSTPRQPDIAARPAMTERPDQSPLTSARSARVRKVAALAGRSARRKQGRFRIEGPQAVRSLLTHRPERAREVFLTERAAADHPELVALARDAEVPTRTVDEQILRALVRDTAAPSGTEEDAAPAETGGALVTPQGVVAVAALPTEDPAAVAAALGALPAGGPVTVVVLHEVRDPGNVGTLIRTADAAGADLVLLTRTSADARSPKAVRASAGSLFHLP